MKLELRVEAKEVQQAIGDIRKKLEKPRDMLREIGDIIVEDIKNRIVRTKQEPENEAPWAPWAPWAPSTAKGRERKGNAALGLLFDSGNLLNSIKAQIVGSHNTLQIGTNVPYAKYLQEGTEKMPARPFLGISKRAQQGIDQAIKLYMEK